MRTDYKGRLEVLSVVFGWVSVVGSIRLYERYQIVHDRRVEKGISNRFSLFRDSKRGVSNQIRLRKPSN